jgi:hypothetical protein
MLTGLGEGIKGLAINAIKIALLIALLIGVVKWMQANPDAAQRMFTAVANATASLVTWVCDWVVAHTSTTG